MKPILVITLQNGLVQHLAATGALDVYVQDLDLRKGFEPVPQTLTVETVEQMQQRLRNAGLLAPHCVAA